MQHMTECGERRGQVPDRQLMHLGMALECEAPGGTCESEGARATELRRYISLPDPNLTLLTISS
jgi:hypothetical protein